MQHAWSKLHRLHHASKKKKARLLSSLSKDHAHPKPSKCQNDKRLPNVMWKPEDEFPGRTIIDQRLWTFHREAQVLQRIARASIKSIVQPLRLLLLGTCSISVLGISSYEAFLLLEPSVTLSTDGLQFIYRYAMENFFASCIWETRSPELIVRAMGLDPNQLLAPLDASTASGAKKQLHLMSLYTARTMVADVMVITQLLSIMRESMLAVSGYAQNVYKGMEPPLSGIKERIIRLAGKGSDVTEISMARYGAHIFPVYEDPSKFCHLVALWSLHGRRPCIWHVAAGQYGFRHSWAQLEIDASFMLRTTTGKHILCIEADATNLDLAHDLQTPNNDLTLEDAAQAYRMLERAAGLKMQRPFRSLCVFLGDSRQLCPTGGTQYVSIRERIRLKKEVDVLIDAKAPLLLAILKWCERYVDDRKMIVLDATPLHYAPLELLLRRNGYTVLDPSHADHHDKTKQEKKPLPRLIYYPTTAATINAVHATVTAGIADPQHCCVLINSPFGLAHLQEMAEDLDARFHPICAAEIYDDYFRQVRIWTRMGYSAPVIQRELDQRFAHVFDVLEEIVQLEKQTNRE